MPPPSPAPAKLARNPLLFLLFRVFFNARFYYPVYAILFLDFGLSVEEFAVLNFAWALTIVLLEVPSGAFADQCGRKVCVIVAAVLMILEMLVLCLTPVGGGSIVFYMFLVNRVLSGAAEAAASGADEALAYDSIPAAEREKTWPRLMVRLIRYQAAAFILVTVIGAAAYDADLVNETAARLGSAINLSPATTLKIPLYLTLGMALVTLFVTLSMSEAPRSFPSGDAADEPRATNVRSQVARSFRRILEAGVWILRTPAPLILLLIGLFYDSIVRLYYTVNSSYFRLLQIDEAWFGVIGAVASLVGLLSAGPVERLANRHSPEFNFRLVTVLVLAGLASLALAVPYYGVILVAPFWVAMRYLHFFVSHYLNLVTDSHHRATVLSFKGLTMNLSYGLVTLAFGLHTRLIHAGMNGDELAATGETDLNQVALAASMKWWAPYFAVTALAVVLFRRWRYGASLSDLIDRARKEAAEDD